MPKGMKSAPPQQANLNELWSGKGGKASKLKDAPKAETTVLVSTDNASAEELQENGNFYTASTSCFIQS